MDVIIYASFNFNKPIKSSGVHQHNAMSYAIFAYFADHLANGGDEPQPDTSLNDVCDEFNMALNGDMMVVEVASWILRYGSYILVIMDFCSRVLQRTAESAYNMTVILQNTQIRHSTAHPLVWCIGCLLLVYNLYAKFALASSIYVNTMKPVCNDHLYDKIYYLWFIQ